MRTVAAACLLACLAPALAVAEAGRPIWREQRSFQPVSRTAEAITGPVTLSAASGGRMVLTFGDGKSVGLIPAGGGRREWDFASPGETTMGEVFRLSRDPGPLLLGNVLCGDPKTSPARFVVFLDRSSSDGVPALGAAVFESRKAPYDIHSPGLCATYNYTAN